jgi:hypothetical protein
VPPWIQHRVQRTRFNHATCDIKHKYNHSGSECNTFSKAFLVGSRPVGRSHPTATEHRYDWIHRHMYSDLSVSMASQEMEEHHERSRRTDIHMNQPAGSCRRRLWTAVTFITPFLFCWWYTLWDGNSLTISILTLSKSPTCCQHSCRVAIRHEVWNYVQKLSHNPVSSCAPTVHLATLQSAVHKCTEHFFRHCTVWRLFSMPAKQHVVKTYSTTWCENWQVLL